MKAEIEKHIESMREQYLGSANYNASRQHTTSTGAEILEEVIQSTLALPVDRLNEMHNTIARENYTRLDFYIVKRIRLTCRILGRKEAISN